MNTIQLNPNTIVSILSLVVAVFIGLASLVVSYVIIQTQRAVRRAREAEGEFIAARKAMNALSQKLSDTYERELLRGHLEGLRDIDPIIRSESIKAIGERGTHFCVLPLLNLMKDNSETDENRRMAENAIFAIIGRIESHLPGAILEDMGIKQRYIDVILTGFRQTIEQIQKRRILKKSKIHKT